MTNRQNMHASFYQKLQALYKYQHEYIACHTWNFNETCIKAR